MVTKAEMRKVIDSFNELLEQWGVESHVAKTGKATYDLDGRIVVKVELNPVSEDGEVVTQEASDVAIYGWKWGVRDKLGKRFTSNGKTFEVIGVRRNASKNPLLSRCMQDGKTYYHRHVGGSYNHLNWID